MNKSLFLSAAGFVAFSAFAGVISERSVDEMMDEYIASMSWNEGMNEKNGKTLFVAKGSGIIQAPRNSPAYIDSRVNAYNKAMLDAKKALVEYLGTAIESNTEKAYAEGASIGPNAAQLSEAKALSQETYKKMIRTAAEAKVMGYQCSCSFESIPADGKGEIGVVAVWSQKLNQMATAMVTGCKPPEGVAKKPIVEQVTTDQLKLASTFGVHQLLDETGSLVLVGYGQAGAVSESKMSAKGAQTKAKSNAMAAIREFAGEQVAVASEMSNTESVTEFANAAEAYSNESGMKEKIAAGAAKMNISGIAPLRSWKFKHPANGRTIYGVVVTWKPRGPYVTPRTTLPPVATTDVKPDPPPATETVLPPAEPEEVVPVAGPVFFLEATSPDLIKRFSQLFVDDGFHISDTTDGATHRISLKGKYRVVKEPVTGEDGTQLSLNVRITTIDDSKVLMSFNNDPRKATSFTGDAGRQCELVTAKAFKQMQEKLLQALEKAKTLL